MRCPFCKKADSRVIDSRAADDGNTIRRRRECTGCGKRFTTYEVVEKIPLMVIKNDGRRVVFDRNKLLNGLIRSCDKRDIPTERIVSLANDIEKELSEPTDMRIFSIAEALEKGFDVDRIWELTKIDRWFLYKLQNINNIKLRIYKYYIFS